MPVSLMVVVDILVITLTAGAWMGICAALIFTPFSTWAWMSRIGGVLLLVMGLTILIHLGR